MPGVMLRCLLATLVLPSLVLAQGVTTSGVRGVISSTSERELDARVRISHDLTGVSVSVRVANGRYLVEGLEPGGPYTLEASAIGFAPMRKQGVVLALGELRRLDFALSALAVRLDTVAVNDTEVRAAGAVSAISSSMLEHLPTLNRDLYDFLRLVPQVSTKISLAAPGISAGGMGFRFNNFLINGVSERTLSGGVSNASSGNKSVPLAAVQQYQVLLAPYDVRYGDFTGALVNTVTKSGTNQFRGAAFIYGRTDQLARHADGAVIRPYKRLQYGFSWGGPILRDRLHFFVAPELQRFTYPATGPYVGQPADAERPVPVSAIDLARFDATMRRFGLTSGSAGAIENSNPLRNVFLRLDLALPEARSRLVAWHNYGSSNDVALSRERRDTFALSSYQLTRESQSRVSAMQLHTSLSRGGGGHNELLLSFRADGLTSLGAVQQPIVRVAVPSGAGRVYLVAGTSETAQTSGFRSQSLSIKDNLSLPLTNRLDVAVGAEYERFSIDRGGAAGSYGSWNFASMDAFEAGVVERYDARVDFGNENAVLGGEQYASYASVRWQAGGDFVLTTGLRGELLSIRGHAPYQPGVDSVLGRRTDDMPRERIELSPRMGFSWDVNGTGVQQLRGGIGVFTGRYPLAWAHSALSSYGVGGQLSCNTLGSPTRYPPTFNPDYRSPPRTCSGGATLAQTFHGDVDLLNRNLRMLRVARGSLAFDRRLPWGLTSTSEVLLSNGLTDAMLVNLNLAAPTRTDINGRVLYEAPRRSDYTEAIELRNTKGLRSYQLSTQLRAVSTRAMNGSFSYTFSRTRDVQTLTRVNTRGTAAWASARVTSGLDTDESLTISANDVPHRVVLAGSFAAPWRRAPTELSFYYVGESGRPFTYVAFGLASRGDLNGDGSNANDPIYIPRNAIDSTEVRFSGVSEAAGADNSPSAIVAREQLQSMSFEQFVAHTSCLNRQRGQIMRRNSCREPWSNFMIASVRQEVSLWARRIELQADLFNVFNVLNRKWGARREAVPQLLEHVGQSTSGRPLFRFDPSLARFTTIATESSFQLQLAARYRF